MAVAELPSGRVFAANDFGVLPPTVTADPHQDPCWPIADTECKGWPRDQLGLGRFWVRADYLSWWTRAAYLPPLVTSSPVDMDGDDAGQLDDPGTVILFGDDYVDRDMRPGYRLHAGLWLDPCRTLGVAADYLKIGARSTHFRASSSGSRVLARPFYNVQTGEQDAEIVAFPDVMSGTVEIRHRDDFRSTGVWLVGNLWDCQWCCDACGSGTCGDCADTAAGQFDVIAGYRYCTLDDVLSVHEDLTVTEPVFDGSTYDLTDSFRTDNEFHGGELGMRASFYRGFWSLDLFTKIAIGNNRQVSDVEGRTITTITNLPPVEAAGGLLTAETNIGRSTHDQFTVIPQLRAELGWHFFEDFRFFAGYSLIYWPHVLRAADQIDLAVDPRNLPPVQPGGTIFPAPRLVSTDFWAQGVHIGAEYRY